MRMFQTGFGRALALTAGVLLTGCGTSSGIQVQREAHLPADSAGARFMMLAARGQERDPAYAQTAELVAAEMVARHFVRVTEPSEARFAVMVWDRRAEGATDPVPFQDPAAGGASGSQRLDGGGNGSGGGRRGSRGQGNSPTRYTSYGTPGAAHRVEIQIYDLTRAEGSGQHVFTADARITEDKAAGRGSAELVTAAMRDFPGSGSQNYSVQ